MTAKCSANAFVVPVICCNAITPLQSNTGYSEWMGGISIEVFNTRARLHREPLFESALQGGGKSYCDIIAVEIISHAA